MVERIARHQFADFGDVHNLFQNIWGGNISSSKSPLTIGRAGGKKGFVSGGCLYFNHRRWGKEITGCI